MISHLNGNFFEQTPAKSRFANVLAYDERADRANVNDAKLRQLFGDHRRLASIRATDVYRTKKYNPAHLVI